MRTQPTLSSVPTHSTTPSTKCARKGCDHTAAHGKILCADHGTVHMTDTLDNVRAVGSVDSMSLAEVLLARASHSVRPRETIETYLESERLLCVVIQTVCRW